MLGKRWPKKKRRGGGGEDVLFGVVGMKIEGSRSKQMSSSAIMTIAIMTMMNTIPPLMTIQNLTEMKLKLTKPPI